MPKLESNEFYNTDLIGSHVLSETDECFGDIQRVLETKTGTILEINNNNKIYLVPFNESFVLNVDTKNKSLKIKNLKEISSLWYLI